MANPIKAIKRIQVRGLFGTYDYDLFPSSLASHPERLLILYGDNGSGKTTILRILFHLLAPEDGKGHKTQVARIPFNRFEVDFTSGERVWAKRNGEHITGTFTMGLRLNGKKESSVELVANEEGVIKAITDEQNIKIKAFLSKLQQLNIGLYLLSDDRTVRLAGKEGREIPFVRPDLIDDEALFYHDWPTNARIARGKELQIQAQQLLVESIKRAEMWIQSQAVRGAAQGESDVNTLYGAILKRISSLPLKDSQGGERTVPDLENRIEQLETRSKRYAQYGLLPEFSGRDILSIMKEAPTSHITLITNVVVPYVESVEKKLDAMERLQRQIDALVRIVNSFFTRKKLVFEIHAGFDIVNDSGKKLAPHMLSSGERHLLLLFCNTLIALDRQSIFIIDEPEISLNIKWQRKLLASLLECAGENPVQYIFATHSFELLAQHKDNTIKLTEVLEGPNGREANT